MIPVSLGVPRDCDVLVVGGGVAGLPAAVAAARTGARTVLVEANAFFGGTAILALHRYIGGLYLGGNIPPPVETLNTGLPREIAARLAELAPDSQPTRLGRVWVLPFQTAHLRFVYNELAKTERTLTTLFSAEIVGVQRVGSHIASVAVRTAHGEENVVPRAVIDCTGSGAVVRLAKAAFELAPEFKRPVGGYTIHLDGIVGDRECLGVKIARQLSQLPEVRAEGLPPFAGFAAGAGAHDGFCKFSVSPELARLGNDNLARLITRVHSLLLQHQPELLHSRIVERSPRALEREGLRMKGEARLEESDVIAARKFPNSVARSAWPMEFWGLPSNPRYTYIPDGDYYEIPRGCLHSNTVDNLFAGGRCISGASEALASARAMGTCMATGAAAGTEAALFARRDQRSPALVSNPRF